MSGKIVCSDVKKINFILQFIFVVYEQLTQIHHNISTSFLIKKYFQVNWFNDIEWIDGLFSVFFYCFSV